MTDEDWMGDTDGGAAGEGNDQAAGDGQPGVALEGHPVWRGGAFGSGGGLLGMIKVSNTGPPRRGAPSHGADPYPLPPAYMPGPHGGVQLRPGFAQAHPDGPFDWAGMAKEAHWPQVAGDLARIAKGAGSFAKKPWDIPGYLWNLGQDVWKAQDEANRHPNSPPGPGVDRATNGLP